jgi:hypothetical protein
LHGFAGTREEGSMGCPRLSRREISHLYLKSKVFSQILKTFKVWDFLFTNDYELKSNLGFNKTLTQQYLSFLYNFNFFKSSHNCQNHMRQSAPYFN